MDATAEHELDVHAYVLMPNHVHLLATPTRSDSIGKTMQSVGRRYVQYFNRRYERTGTLWEGRYRATAIDGERYFLNCCRYIELNPVRAGLVDAPGDYRWSSYRRNALGRPDALVTEHEALRRLGGTLSERRESYRILFQVALAEAFLTSIRDSTQHAWALGDDLFCRDLEAHSGRRPRRVSRGRPRKQAPDVQEQAPTRRRTSHEQ